MSGHDESPRRTTEALEGNATNTHHQYGTGRGEIVDSAAVKAGPLSFEEVFSGQNLDDVELPPPCETLTITLCGSVLDDLESWAQIADMTSADFAAALVVQGMSGGAS